MNYYTFGKGCLCQIYSLWQEFSVQVQLYLSQSTAFIPKTRFSKKLSQRQFNTATLTFYLQLPQPLLWNVTKDFVLPLSFYFPCDKGKCDVTTLTKYPNLNVCEIK